MEAARNASGSPVRVLMADGSLGFQLPSGKASPSPLPAPEHLHAHCARKIGRHVARVMGTDDEADDLVQEVLITLLTRIGTLRNPALFDAWVAKITRRKALHVLRERSLRRRTLTTWQTNHDPILEVDLDGRVVASR